MLMVDMAHIAGLVAAGLHPNPVEYADVVTTTTHKTLRGPRGGMILCNDEEICQGNQQSHLPRHSGRSAVPCGGRESGQLLGSAAAGIQSTIRSRFSKTLQALAEALTEKGLIVVSGGTDNHLMLVDLRRKGITGKLAEKRLDAIGITCNKNAIPFDPEKPFVTSGIRLGTPAVTTRGMKEEQMREIADIIDKALTDFEANKEECEAADGGSDRGISAVLRTGGFDETTGLWDDASAHAGRGN